MTLGEVGTLFGGLTGKSKLDFQVGGARFVSYRNVFANIATDVTPEDAFVRIGDGESQRQLRRGDVLFTGSSETVDQCGMSSVVTAEPPEPLYLNSFCIGFRPHDPHLFNPEFAKHLFRSAALRQQIVRTAHGVTRFNVSKARLAQVTVPIPPTSEQKRLADILDTLDTHVKELSGHLSSELRARRRQYEHYRNSLLDFSEAA